MAETRELTLMFYFASDNPLAPAIVSQLKALKEAGFHSEANVVVHFDPNDNTPVHIFDVNLVNKIRAGGKHQIGLSLRPPFVRNLAEDKVWGKSKKEIIKAVLKHELGHKSIGYAPPDLPAEMSNEQNPREALQAFLDFCQKYYPARHYMLFILGHGLVMGHNLFLFDEHAKEHSLSLKDLAAVLRSFKRKLDEQNAQFQLLSFHSCSMGGLEVAYELQGTANYMLAAQGPSFVGNWPFGQILIAIFNKIERLAAAKQGTKKSGNGSSSKVNQKERPATLINELVKEIWSYCYRSSYDFQLVGYSFDVCLCDLNKVPEIKTPLRNLSVELIKGLVDPLIKERILLAHWDAQSYWQESYTDLYDFCFRLHQRCEDAKSALKKGKANLQCIQEKCEEVIRVLTSGDDKLVIRADFTGPAYQFSHGLFVLFPWAQPGNSQFWLDEYRSYQFEETSWRKFLDRYFQDTMRQSRGCEQHLSKGFELKAGLDEFLLENITGEDFNHNAKLGKGDSMSAKRQRSNGKTFTHDAQSGRRTPYDSSSELGWFDWLWSGLFNSEGSDKPGGGSALGENSGSSSIKNYPSFTRVPQRKD